MLSPEGNQRGEGSSREGGFPESQSPPKGVFQCGVFRCTSVGGGEGVGGAERDRASSDSKRGIGKFVFSTALYLLSNIFPGKRQHFLGQSHGKLSVPPCDLRRGCWGCLWSHGGREGPPGLVGGWREVPSILPEAGMALRASLDSQAAQTPGAARASGGHTHEHTHPHGHTPTQTHTHGHTHMNTYTNTHTHTPPSPQQSCTSLEP